MGTLNLAEQWHPMTTFNPNCLFYNPIILKKRCLRETKCRGTSAPHASPSEFYHTFYTFRVPFTFFLVSH